MRLEGAIIAPIAVGALMWIVDMLLPEGRTARVAGAVAGIMVIQALLVPLLMWLSAAGSDADVAPISPQTVLTETAHSD